MADPTTTLAIVQARMSSSRRPGKVLADVGGEPMLALLLTRLGRCRRVDGIVVATSSRGEDDPVAEVAATAGVGVYRGPLDDVLGRFVGAAGDATATVVRITGDCPLVDPAVVDAAVELFRSDPHVAYASNLFPRTFPKGLDVEVIAADALRAVDAEPRTPYEREHVTPAVNTDGARFPARSLTADEDLHELRWTVDTEDDLDFVRAVVERLGARRYDADLVEILAAVRRLPSLAAFRGGRRG